MPSDNMLLVQNTWSDDNKDVHCYGSKETDMQNLYVDILATYLPLV